MPTITSVRMAMSLIENDKSKVLGLKVGTHDITPGQEISKTDAQTVPQLSFAVPSSTGSYLVIGLDIDAPFPSFSVFGPFLHWIQPDLKTAPNSTTQELISTSPFVANYVGPAPPPRSAPHLYVFLLYEQPHDFDGTKFAPPNGENLGNWGRIRWDLGAWERKTGLGNVKAANYFRSN